MFGWFTRTFRKEQKPQVRLRIELKNGDYHEEVVPAERVMERYDELQKQFNPGKPLEERTFVWCLVGNIVGKHYYGPDKEIKFGSKHFSTGTKVYCFGPVWGDGYRQIKVIGKHRKSGRMVLTIMSSERITNWRIQQVFHPYIMKVMHANRGWTDSDSDRDDILSMLKWLPGSTKKVDE